MPVVEGRRRRILRYTHMFFFFELKSNKGILTSWDLVQRIYPPFIFYLQFFVKILGDIKNSLYLCQRNFEINIIMETIVKNIQNNSIAVINVAVVKETTYQKLKRLSKKYNLQTNDPKFARVWCYALYAWHMCLYRCSYRAW